MDVLLARGLRCLTALDLSANAQARARARLGDAARHVTWITADVTGPWSVQPVDIWHDRALFHFLTDPADRAAYAHRVRETVKPGGAVVIATFAPDGPERCSGLPVKRHSAESVLAELGAGFRLEKTVREEHRTPAGTVQPFTCCRFRRID